MAKEPTPTPVPAQPRRDVEQEMLMREVDEAVRQDQATDFAKKFGWPIGLAVIGGLLAFGAYLVWDSRSEAEMERQSEQLVTAIDELEAGNPNLADAELVELSAGSDGPAAMAKMLRAGIALENGNTQRAVELFDEVANDTGQSQLIRDIAAIRSVTAQYDELDPQAVIDRMGSIAQPGNANYGSAAELVAHAYLAQNKPDQAGPLFVAIAQDDDVPESLRARSRQMAGRLGYDSIDDVDAVIAEITGERPADETAPASQPAE